MIDVQALSMRYGKFQALENVTFQARSGEILGLLGPNGAGKTTLMRILTTYLHPFSGTAKIEGIDLLELEIHLIKKAYDIKYPNAVTLYFCNGHIRKDKKTEADTRSKNKWIQPGFDQRNTRRIKYQV